jgi:hypothetical protein
MREYKKLNIPDRKPRDSFDLNKKRSNYCDKSDCGVNKGGTFVDKCNNCLFGKNNIETFKEWYLNKNKKNKTIPLPPPPPKERIFGDNDAFMVGVLYWVIIIVFFIFLILSIFKK